jgi:transposase
MLTAEDRFVIKDLYRKGVSISEIARQTGHDRKTVRKIATSTQPITVERATAPRRVHKLDPFVPYLERRVAEGVVNAAKLFAEVRSQGYTGGKTRVKDWLENRRPQRDTDPVVRFETAPGEQAQVDFASFGTILHQGREQRLSAFLMTLGWSRMLFVRFFVTCDWVAFLRGHLAAFTHFGGTPRTVLHDNLKSAVLEHRGGHVRFHPRYLDFADYYGFTPRACQPYRARTKGKVERAVRYVRENFWPGMTYTDLDDLNRQAQIWLDTIANVRMHATTGVTPVSRLADEQLSSIAARPPYEITPILLRHASRDGWVRYGGAAYAIPLAATGQAVLLKVTDRDEVVITTPQGTLLATHPLASSPGASVGHPVPRPSQVVPPPPPEPLQTPSVPALPDAPQVEVRSLDAYDALLEVD